MRTTVVLKRAAAVIGVLLVLSLIIGGVSVASVLRRPFPQVEGNLQLSGLTAPVDIYRDDMGIPHVYAQNRADMLFAQGYVHAQDRFWQMELTRRLAAGRLAEVLGQPALETDRLTRTIGFNRVAQNLLTYYQQEYPALVADLESYAAGVNAYLDGHRDRISFNHTIVNMQRAWPIEPWTTYDTVAFGTYMASSFETSWGNDYSNTSVFAAIEPAKRPLVLPRYPSSRPAIAQTEPPTGQGPLVDQALDPQIAELFAQAGLTKASAASDLRSLSPVPPGSNSWVISGAHTASGKPLLANDPHLQAGLPANFYQISLHSPGFEVVGFSLPGGPGVIIGHNAQISWGLTNAVIDTQEAYIERLNPDNPMQYEVNGSWRDLETIQEVIKVAGQPDTSLEVRLTRHGPIMQQLGDDTNTVVAVQWQGHRRPFRLFKAVLDLNVATDYASFREALRYWEAPALNFVYADTAGNIAHQLVANVPIRPAARFAVPGWNDAHEWTGWVPYDDLPAVLNPPEGYIVTANNLITPQEFPAQFITDPGDRAQRITDLLKQQIASGTKITPEQFSTMQLDYYSQLAAAYTPLIVQLAPSNPALQPIAERLRSWDHQLAPTSPEAGFVSIFLMQLSSNLQGDELGNLYDAHTNEHSLAILLALALLADDPANAWWDDVGTPEREQQQAIIRRALDDTLAWLREHAGPELDDWQWGKIHTITFYSLPLGISGVAPLEQLVNRGPYPVGGDVTTINDHSWLYNNVADTFFYPTLRFVADMGSPEIGQGLGSIGQSGHPSHTNYDDMIPLWLRGESRPMPLNPVDRTALDHLVLAPAAQ